VRTELSVAAKLDLEWWLVNLKHSGVNIVPPRPAMVIYSDASLTGWGAACKDVNTGGHWTKDQQNKYIKELELMAAFYALQTFTASVVDCSLELMVDNTTAVSYINRQGGCKSRTLYSVALSITQWCEDRGIT
jgi:hypothetical protein